MTPIPRPSRSSTRTPVRSHMSPSTPKTTNRTVPPLSTSNKPEARRASISIPSVLSQSKTSAVPGLPTELLLHILAELDIPNLCKIRLVSRRFRRLSNLTLAPQIEEIVEKMEAEREQLHTIVEEAQITKRPMLRHYRQWLRNVHSNEVTEATWYAKPPEELKVVCECLCILKGVKEPPKTSLPNSTPSKLSSSSSTTTSTTDLTADPTDPSTNRLTWATIRKHMSRYDFKTWITSLRTSVDTIPFSAIGRVEQIIINDPHITYERLREVSTAGYNLLILVAACLQYCAIAEELKVKRNEFLVLDKEVARLEMFLSALEGDDAAVAIIAQAAKL
ncbi:Dynein heavy chain 10, axonemal [Rhizophlyctis rosea]|uniref:Dynein heavy chain 10, axonemal n=1 Tax=Rhizophlyctis rosea TaxID=64517 RepID=A0AAD5S6P3_9FUNG|nr:Dynein heavy chain 10, axonemal [Rhizophlyctis rosea]